MFTLQINYREPYLAQTKTNTYSKYYCGTYKNMFTFSMHKDCAKRFKSIAGATCAFTRYRKKYPHHIEKIVGYDIVKD